MSELSQKYKNYQSLAVISYSSYDEYGDSLIQTLIEDFESLCIFPFQTKDVPKLTHFAEQYFVSVQALENYYGALSRLSRIYAFESFLKELLLEKLHRGLVCSKDLVVIKSVMNTLFAQPNVKYTYQNLKKFPSVYVVYFKVT